MQRRDVAASSFFYAASALGRAGALFLHIPEVDLQRPDRDLDLPDRNPQRGDQQQQRSPEHPGRKREEIDIDQEHRHHAQKQARHSERLHRAGEVEAAAEVVDLCLRHLRRVLQVLLLERADQLRIGEKAVRVGQQDQRNSRKQQGWGSQRKFFHISLSIKRSSCRKGTLFSRIYQSSDVMPQVCINE